jgi:hypothetical protein
VTSSSKTDAPPAVETPIQEETRAHDASRIKLDESSQKESYHSLSQVVRLWPQDTSVHGVQYALDPEAIVCMEAYCLVRHCHDNGSHHDDCDCCSFSRLLSIQH